MRSPGAQQAKRGGRPTADEAAFGHADGSVTLVDLVTGSMRTLSGQADGGIDALSFSRDGRTLATGEETGTVAVWDVRSGALRESYAGHAAAVRAAVFSPDGRTLYTADYDGSVIAWDVTGARRLGQPFTFAGGFSSGAAAVSHDGSLLAVSPGPDRVALLRAATRAPLDPLLRSSAGDVGGIAFSPDGKLVAAAGSRQVVVWNTTTKKTVRIVSLAGNGASKVEFTPDGRTFAIGRSDSVAALYDARTGRQTGALAGEGSIDDIDFNPDGKLLATASLTGVVTLWDVARQTKLRDLPGAVAVYAVRFSPDGKLVAVGDSSGAVVLWDAAKGRRVGEPLVGHAGGVDSIDFSPDGKTLATSTDDGNLRLWDVATRKLIGAPLHGSYTGGTVRFFPDGKHVLGVFGSGTGIVWNVDPAGWKAKACSVAGRNLTRAEWTDFLGRRSYRKVCP